jgi:3-hydroxyacyl-CoA dehydrogenase
LGLFGVMDIIGIDLIYHILKKSTKWVFFRPQVRKIANFLNPYMEKGWFGRKRKQVFYAYPDPAFEAANFIEKRTREKTYYCAPDHFSRIPGATN